MPLNVEIKARVLNLEKLLKRAAELSGGPGKILAQEDVFFNITNGRLKLRDEKTEGGSEAWLIHYNRPDGDGPRLCQYRKYQVGDSNILRSVLSDALGEKGKVEKERRLFMVGQTRIHIDTVKNLGSFMELEVCLEDGQTEEMGKGIAKSLMKKLNISESDLVTVAYTDLLESANNNKPASS